MPFFKASIILRPSEFEIITDGIVISPGRGVPPILNGFSVSALPLPSSLFERITATAPANCAFFTFVTKAHPPLCNNAIFPFISLEFTKLVQASVNDPTKAPVDVASPSSANTISLVISSLDKDGPKAAATYV